MHGLGRGFFRLRAAESISNNWQHAALFGLTAALMIFGVFPSLHAQTPVTVGYRDFNYGTTVYKSLADALWDGQKLYVATQSFTVYRFQERKLC